MKKEQEQELVQHQTEFVEVFFAEGFEWGVRMGDDGFPKIMYVPHEIEDGIKETWSKLDKRISREEERTGLKLIRHLPVFELVGEDPGCAVLTQGAYFQITVHVSTE